MKIIYCLSSLLLFSLVSCKDNAIEHSQIASENSADQRIDFKEYVVAEAELKSDSNADEVSAQNLVPIWSREGGALELRNRATGKCLDVKHNGKHNGADVIMWNCNGQNNQRWERQDVGGNKFRLRSTSAGKCLDFVGGNGGKVVLWDCHGRGNQVFAFVGFGDDSAALIKRADGNTCLDLTRFGTIVHWNCHGGPEQVLNASSR